MQPLPSVAWVSAPVDGSRVEHDDGVADRRRGVDVVAVGADRHALRSAPRARPVAQPAVGALAMQPVVPAGWVSAPVDGVAGEDGDRVAEEGADVDVGCRRG